jgi:hypothetical protein
MAEPSIVWQQRNCEVRAVNNVFVQTIVFDVSNRWHIDVPMILRTWQQLGVGAEI